MSPTCARIHKLLKSGPKRTNELLAPDVSGSRLNARMGELKHKYGIPWEKKPVGGGQFLYWLTDDRPPLVAGEPTGTPPAPAPVWPGKYVVCTKCSWTFEEEGSSRECTKCGASAAWLEEWPTKGARDFAARRVDPEKVDRELKYWERVRADQARRAA